MSKFKKLLSNFIISRIIKLKLKNKLIIKADLKFLFLNFLLMVFPLPYTDYLYLNGNIFHPNILYY